MYSYCPGVGYKGAPIFWSYRNNDELLEALSKNVALARGQIELFELNKYGQPTALIFESAQQLRTLFKETPLEKIQRVYLYGNNGFFYRTDLKKK